MDVDKQLILYDYIVSEYGCSFGCLDPRTTRGLISKNLSISKGLKLCKKYFPNQHILEINDDFIEARLISGSESVIYFKENDDEFIYKLNDPYLKTNDDSFNNYIWNFLLLDLFFPRCKYTDFRYVENLSEGFLFMKQEMFDTDREPSVSEINKKLTDYGFKHYPKYNGYIISLELNGITFYCLITDVAPANCRIVNGELQAFDVKFKLL